MSIIKDKKEVIKVFKKIQEILNKDDNVTYKIIKVGSATWTNSLTKRPQKTNDIYVLGWKSSSRPIIITEISVNNGNKYRLTDRYSHCNFSGHIEGVYISQLKGDGKLLPEDLSIEVRGQEFCNPITALHVIETGEKDIANLLRVTMSSQNFDDAYSDYSSVCNSELDEAIKCTNTYRMLLKNNSSPLEMLTGLSASSLQALSSYDLNQKLREITSLGKDEVWVKLKSDTTYAKLTKSTFRRAREKCSQYYPVYDYNDIVNMKIEIPRDNFDLGVYGLGSAGTAILDQVLRSNWIKSIYLCDFDRVEYKNMINQWYDRNSVGLKKACACYYKIRQLERNGSDIINTNFFIKYDDDKEFQLTKLDDKKYKYVISGFDSINARLDFLNSILDGKIEAKYLIDCRYLDLACSIYMIDLENMDEIQFYKANLEADAELIKARNEKEKLTKEEFVEWFNRKGYFSSGCYGCRTKILKQEDVPSDCVINLLGGCKSQECIDNLYDIYLKSVPNPLVSRTDASCVKYNYIDIYKYVGAIVFGAFRKIENEGTKPFTLVEAETDIKGLPNYMVVRG